MFIGYCKECGNEVFEKDIIPDYKVYECSKCGHPHSKDELWDEIPYYLTVKENEKVGEYSKCSSYGIGDCDENCYSCIDELTKQIFSE